MPLAPLIIPTANRPALAVQYRPMCICFILKGWGTDRPDNRRDGERAHAVCVKYTLRHPLSPTARCEASIMPAAKRLPGIGVDVAGNEKSFTHGRLLLRRARSKSAHCTCTHAVYHGSALNKARLKLCPNSVWLNGAPGHSRAPWCSTIDTKV